MRWKEIMEAFNSQAEITTDYEGESMVNANFTIGDKKYLTTFTRLTSSRNEWTFDFESTTGTKFNNNNDMGTSSIQVFSAVIKVLGDFISHYHPDLLHFSGEKSDSRDHLYGVLLKRFEPELTRQGYEVRTKNQEKYIDFNIVKRDA